MAITDIVRGWSGRKAKREQPLQLSQRVAAINKTRASRATSKPRWSFRNPIAKAVDPPSTPSATDEIGFTGLNQFHGQINEEFLRELHGRRAIEIWREMSNNDATVGAVLFAIQMLIRNVEWDVEPGGSDQIDMDKAEFLKSNMHDMSETWSDMIAAILSFIPMGFSVHEPVFRRRLGESEDPKFDSKFDDGRMGWSKIPGRAQETISRWLFDDDSGELNGLVQTALPKLTAVEIPRSRFLLFRTTTAKGNPEGRSALRTAYVAWFFKRRIEEIEGIGIERDLAGLPVATVPLELFGKDAKAGDKAILEEIFNIVTSIKRDELEGVVMPGQFDDKGNQMYKLELLSTGGRRQFNTTEIINRYDNRIAGSVLADVILMGQQAVGSYALSDNKTELFLAGLGAWVDSVTQTFNRQAIPQLFRLNTFPKTENLPQLVHSDFESVDLAVLGEYILKTTTAGVLNVANDEELESYVRRQGNLPPRSFADVDEDDPEVKTDPTDPTQPGDDSGDPAEEE